MANKKEKTNKKMKENRMEERTYNIRGHIKFEEDIPDKEKLKMKAYARVGRRTLASAPVDKDGKFKLKFERTKMPPVSMKLIIGPPINEGKLTHVNTKQIQILSTEWKVEGDSFFVKKEISLKKDLTFCLLPREIKICGIVCKDMSIEDTDLTRCCPVPYAKVEVYDVDSLIFKLEKPSFKKAEIIYYKKPLEISPPSEPPVPMPIKRGAMTPEKESAAESTPSYAEKVKYLDSNIGRIDIVDSYQHVPIYSKDLLGEVYTDECGEFCLTFMWFPGCTSPDVSPDLIFKVSQTLWSGGGPVTHTIYSEGYSDTRWDVPDYHWVKLDAADDVFVACNPDCHPLLDRRALLQGVGIQEIYNHIEQGDDPSRACGFVYNGNFVKSPFGAELDIRGVFGSKVEEVGERWYRISYAKTTDCGSKPADDDPSAWTPITDALTDTMYYWDAGEGALHYESVALGPHSLPGHTNVEFYEIRNTEDDSGHDLYWMDQNRIARWETAEKISGEWVGKIDDGLYVLKIEVFDADGNPAPDVLIGDDEGNYAYMFLYINNKNPIVEIKEVYNGGSLISVECGSFEHSIGEEVKFLVDAYHEDDHLRYWRMTYQIGYGPSSGMVDRQCDGTVWGGPILEDFRGKNNEYIIWTNFDEDLGLTADPPTACSTFGISIQLGACTKATNGYSFLGSYHGHYQEVHAGLAAHHSEEGE